MPEMEHKSFPALTLKMIDEARGIVEHLIAVMGNRDSGGDVIHPGAFTKTITEQGLKVRVLDQHKADSIMRVIGKPLAMREVGRGELPPSVLAKYPDATGALLATTQFLMNTPEGKGAFERIRSGAVDEYSFGYDAIQKDIGKAGDGSSVRNLREIKLYEYSPVIWGMNSATTTLSAKAAPSECKPWNVFKDGEQYCVYKVNESGERTGDSLGCHATEGEARSQVEALFANEPKAADAPDETKVTKTEADGDHPSSHYLVVEDAQKPSTWHLRVKGPDGKPDHRLMGAAWAALHGGYRGQKYEGPNKAEAITKLTALYKSENLDTPKEGELPDEEKAGRIIAKRNAERLAQIRKLLKELEDDAGIGDAPEPQVQVIDGKSNEPSAETPLTPTDGAEPGPTISLSEKRRQLLIKALNQL